MVDVISSVHERAEIFHLSNKTKFAFSSGYETYKLELQNTGTERGS